MSAAHASPMPLEGNYPVALATAIVALIPFIVVSTADALYRPEVRQALGATPTGLEIVSGLAVAGYAFGALSGGDLVNRVPQRHLFLAAELLFVLGCALAAVAGGIAVYGAGRVLQGLATGVLLIAALPPVIQRFPPARMPITAVAINIGFFGAVTAGPLIGGVVSAGHAWRWFDAGLGGIGLAVGLCAALSLPLQAPPNPGLRPDFAGLALALPATALPFWGVSELTGHGFGAPLFFLPLGLGLVAFVALILLEYHKEEPLSPVKQMWHTFPLIGTLAAMMGGAGFITLLSLGEQYLEHVRMLPPVAAGLAFWPDVPAVLLAAAALGLLFRTRYLPLLVLAGMAVLMGGGGLLLARLVLKQYQRERLLIFLHPETDPLCKG
ncbi:MAG: MFS transporter, partial [Stellaceae bacterium]